MDQTHKGVLSGTVLKTRWDISPTWYALGISPGDPTSMQGFHSKSGEILVIIDEGGPSFGIPSEPGGVQSMRSSDRPDAPRPQRRALHGLWIDLFPGGDVRCHFP